jgi:hypothetical protein
MLWQHIKTIDNNPTSSYFASVCSGKFCLNQLYLLPIHNISGRLKNENLK